MVKMKRLKIQDPIKARAVVAELISKGGVVENFPPRMTDKDWILIANRILEVYEDKVFQRFVSSVPVLN